jgi:deoxyribonuclease V
MLLAVDVHYRGSRAVAAGVLFQDWEDREPFLELTVPCATAVAYEPGQFYLRELPCILELLKQIEGTPDAIVIDGYVYLGSDRSAGLGKHLFDALQGRSAIIGVAKSRFRDAPAEAEVLRGGSRRALYVTAVGVSEPDAKSCIARMHGEGRLPVLLRRADRLSRL